MVAAAAGFGTRLLSGSGSPDQDGVVTIDGDGMSASGRVPRDTNVGLHLRVTEPGQVTIDVLGRLGFDPILRLSLQGEGLEINDDWGGEVGAFDGGLQPLDSRIVRHLEPDTYLVEVAGLSGQPGSFDVRVSAGTLSLTAAPSPCCSRTVRGSRRVSTASKTP